MPAKRLHIEQFREWATALGEHQRKAAVAGLVAAAYRMEALIKGDLIPNAKPYPPQGQRGVYKAAWQVIALPNGALLTNLMPYAPIIEYGARAENIKIGRKMLDALTEWVMAKGIGSTTRTTRTGRTRKVKVTAKQARSIAWAIAWSMKGTKDKPGKGIFNGGKGLRILEQANKHARAYAKEEMTRELQKLQRGGAR